MSAPITPKLPDRFTLNPTSQDFTTPKMAPDGTISLKDFHEICDGDPALAEYIQPGSTDIHTLIADATGQHNHRVKIQSPKGKTDLSEAAALQAIKKSQKEVPEWLSIDDAKAYYAQSQASGGPGLLDDFPGAGNPGGAQGLIKSDVTGAVVSFRNPKHPNSKPFMKGYQKQTHYAPDTQDMVDKATQTPDSQGPTK